MDTTHVDERSLRFAIYYRRNQWKRNHFSINYFYEKFNMKRMKLMYEIIVHSKRRKKRD
jgi:hypothetical protein